MPGIFISYRRADNPDAAGRIYDRLVSETATPPTSTALVPVACSHRLMSADGASIAGGKDSAMKRCADAHIFISYRRIRPASPCPYYLYVVTNH